MKFIGAVIFPLPKLIFYVILIGVMSLVWAAPVAAQNPTIEITGVISDPVNGVYQPVTFTVEITPHARYEVASLSSGNQFALKWEATVGDVISGVGPFFIFLVMIYIYIRRRACGIE